MPSDPPADPPPEPRSSIWIGRIGWAILLLTLAQVLITAGRMVWFTGPIADEMEQAAGVRSVGVLQFVAGTYCCWTGRWAGIGLSALFTSLFGSRASYPWLLAAIQVMLPLSVYALLSVAFGDQLRRRTRAVLALGLLALHWDGPINLWDSYYWLTGAIENRLSLSLGLFAIAGLLRTGRDAGPTKRVVAGLAALAAITTGMHQLYGAYLVVALFVGTAVAYRCGNPGRRAWAVVCAVAIVGLVVNVVAPGNALRLAFEKPQRELWWFKSLLNWWTSLAGQWLTDVKLWLATLLIVCHPRAAAAAPRWLRNRPMTVVALAVTAIVGLVLTVVFVNWWTRPEPLPWRTQSAIYFFVLIAWFTGAYALAVRRSTRQIAAPPPVWTGLALCLAFALLGGSNYLVARNDLTTGRAAEYRTAVRARDRRLRDARAAGNLDPKVPPILCLPGLFCFPEVIDGLAKDSPLYAPRNGVYCAYYDLHSIGLTSDDARASTH
jgi:hypothetical protein